MDFFCGIWEYSFKFKRIRTFLAWSKEEVPKKALDGGLQIWILSWFFREWNRVVWLQKLNFFGFSGKLVAYFSSQILIFEKTSSARNKNIHFGIVLRIEILFESFLNSSKYIPRFWDEIFPCWGSFFVYWLSCTLWNWTRNRILLWPSPLSLNCTDYFRISISTVKSLCCRYQFFCEQEKCKIHWEWRITMNRKYVVNLVADV